MNIQGRGWEGQHWEGQHHSRGGPARAKAGPAQIVRKLEGPEERCEPQASSRAAYWENRNVVSEVYPRKVKDQNCLRSFLVLLGPARLQQLQGSW